MVPVEGDDYASMNPWDRRVALVRAAGEHGNRVWVDGVEAELRDELRKAVERGHTRRTLAFVGETLRADASGAEKGRSHGAVIGDQGPGRKRKGRDKRDIPDL